MAQSKRAPLLIVGGGIGGLATALATARAGHPAHVIEKSEEFAEIGAGLQLAPNATRTLETLGVLDTIRQHAVFPKRLVLMDAVTGSELTALNLGSKFREHFGYPYIVMHRGDLLSALLEACRANPLITLEAEKNAIEIVDLGDTARVECADGSVYEADALVGADGLWSRVREIVQGDGDPICAKSVAYRGAIPIGEAPPDSDFDSMTLWIGPDLHLAQYVVRRGEIFNQVAVFRSHRYKEGSENWGNLDELDEHFGAMCPRVRNAVAKINRSRRWAMFDRLPISSWTRNRITLLGDAAHPMLQYIAQGACQALEDAACLGRNLGKHPGDATRAFAAYEKARVERTARVQYAARFFGEMKHLQGVGRSVRNAFLAKRADDDFEYVDWLYGYNGHA